MSIYSVAEASPSRVLGAFRLVLASPAKSIRRSALEMMMCPPGLTTDTDATNAEGETGAGKALLQRAIKEAARLGLLEETDKQFRLGNGINAKLIEERWWPLLFFELVSDPKNENEDLCYALSWFLAQDIGTVPPNWNVMQSKNGDVLTALEMNVVTFGQLQHWAAYLGFGWRCGQLKRSTFVFDPTEHLKLRLTRELGNKAKQFDAPDLLKQIAAWCPVLDGGRYRVELERRQVLPSLPTAHLSAALSQALRRLDEEGWIEMKHASDAKSLLLFSKDDQERISKILWKGTHKA